MKDTELYTTLLGLGLGWRVREVRLDMEKKRVDVWVETCEGGEWRCAECKEISAFTIIAKNRVGGIWIHANVGHTYMRDYREQPVESMGCGR